MKQYKRIIAALLCISLLCGLMAFPVGAANGASSDLVARFADTYQKSSGSFVLSVGARLYAVTDGAPSRQLLDTLRLSAAQFAAQHKPSQLTMPIAYGPADGVRDGDVVVREASGLGEEDYRIEITAQNITVLYGLGSERVYYGGYSYNGLHYGLQKVLQCMMAEGGRTLPCCTIQDSPDTKERTLMLDCARKYWSVEWIQNLIREMSWMGYNTLELHMTEDQGIRMNIWSDGPDCNGNDFGWICGYESASWVYGYGDPNGGKTYSASEIRQIVALAKQYHIEIIPSVDFPGHSDYLISRYASSRPSNFSFRYGGKTYSNAPANLYWYNSGYGNSTSGNWGTVDITNEFSKNFTFAITEAYAGFFGDLGCRKMNIGADEIRGTLDYSTFVQYINDTCAMLKGRGYTVRAFNDYLYGSSSVALDRDLEICYWDDSSRASVQNYLNDGRVLYNCSNNFTYYVLRHVNGNAADYVGDARDLNNTQWGFHHSIAYRIYDGCNDYCSQTCYYNDAGAQSGGWNPGKMYSCTTSIADQPKQTLSQNDARMGGGYFLIWGDWAGWSTESQVWNGLDSGRDGAGTYNLIERMWANATKQWNWDAEQAVSFDDWYTPYLNAVRYFPGYTSCSAAPSIPDGAAIIPSGVYTVDGQSGLCIGVEGDSADSGAMLSAQEKSDRNSQKWIFRYGNNGCYTLENLNSHKYLDVPEASQTSGTSLWQYNYNGSDAQCWRLRDNGNGSYSLISVCGGLTVGIGGEGSIQCQNDGESPEQAWTLTAQAVIRDGNYTIGNSADTGFRLDVYSGSSENGQNIHIWTAHDGDSQKFAFTADEQGRYTITNVNSGKVLDVANGDSGEGANIQQYESNDTAAQRWMVIPYEGYYVIVSCCNGLAVDMSGGGQPKDGTNVQCWTLNWGSAQKWELTSLHTHAYESTVTAPTCTEKGYTTHTCACGDSYVDSYVPALGHRYSSEPVSDDMGGYIQYTCMACGDAKREYLSPIYSSWGADKPSGVDESMIQTRTAYRYRDKVTAESYETSLDGYTQAGSRWVQSGTGTVDYVSSWPSGFSTSHSLYGTYHKSAPAASETATAKRTVDSASTVGYIYWHWCYNNINNDGSHYDGPPEYRWINGTYTSRYTGFHAFYSTTNPSSLDNSSAYGHSDWFWYSNADVCTDTYLYFYLPVYRQSYTDYQKLFTYEKWGDWSEWSEEVYTASDTRQVESRTEYRYVTGASPVEITVRADYDKPITLPLSERVKENMTQLQLSADGTDWSDTLPLTGAVAAINASGLTITPSGALAGIQTFYYRAQASDGTYARETVILLPAGEIYYDETNAMFAFTDGSTGKWTTDGTVSMNGQDWNDSDVDSHCTSLLYHGGSAKMVTVGSPAEDDASPTYPTVQFQFAGTGFDLISLASSQTGGLSVMVADSNGKAVKAELIDTFCGSVFDEQTQTWVADPNAKNSIYQAPIFCCDDLPYGTYTVTVMAAYSPFFDHAGRGEYNFYFDGVRIHNPLGSETSSWESTDLHDALVAAEGFTNTGVYVDGKGEVQPAELAQFGPSNEIHLAAGQAVAFAVAAEEEIPISLGARTIGGKAGEFTVYEVQSTNLTPQTLRQSLNSSTEMHYELSNLTWENGSTRILVVMNTGESLLALTDVRYACGKNARLTLNDDAIAQVQSTASTVHSRRAAFREMADVNPTAWYAPSVQFAVESGAMNGMGGGAFAPNSKLTRAMAVQVLYNLAGRPDTKAAHGFADVTEGAWYADAVAWGAANGIVKGISADRFAPGAELTREQMVAFLYRFAADGAEASDCLADYRDGGTVSAFGVQPMNWAIENGIVSGMGDGLLVPRGTATRAQLAKILTESGSLLF